MATIQHNALNLRCTYWTHNTVYLHWDNKLQGQPLVDYPYQLFYREGNGQIVHLPLNVRDNYFTRKSLVLPGEGYTTSLVLRRGVKYKFDLRAKLQNQTTVGGSVEITMPGNQCTDTMRDLLSDQDVLKELYIIIDTRPQIYKAIAKEFGVDMKTIPFFQTHASPNERPITVQVLQACVDECMRRQDTEKALICNLLRVLHSSDHSRETARIVFEWHTGRDGGPGPCPVCTREQFC